jgi:hypothetical protein
MLVVEVVVAKELLAALAALVEARLELVMLLAQQMPLITQAVAVEVEVAVDQAHPAVATAALAS